MFVDFPVFDLALFRGIRRHASTLAATAYLSKTVRRSFPGTWLFGMGKNERWFAQWLKVFLHDSIELPNLAVSTPRRFFLIILCSYTVVLMHPARYLPIARSAHLPNLFIMIEELSFVANHFLCDESVALGVLYCFSQRSSTGTQTHFQIPSP